MAANNSSLLQAILSSWLGGGLGGKGISSPSLRRSDRYCTATCPDPQCNTVLYFPTHELTVECSGCGQRHTTANLSDRRELSDKEEQFQRSLSELKQMYGGKKTPELVKVKGISNYQCKLLSPFLTTHGKDKHDQPRLLKDLGLGDVFDCGKLCGRSFAIEESFINTVGYGQDKSGSLKYLGDILSRISETNGGRRCLVPVHADGDGHCLVHAVSRCLVGRELFWHALRTNMKDHLEAHKDQYAELLHDFYEEEEWPEIIEEAGPDYHPSDGESLGLRTVHIFALANILHRPIVLLDSLQGVLSKAEYSGIFLPSLVPPSSCRSQDVLNSPIVIAWSSAGHNHFIPLVPVKDQPLPRLPQYLQPKVWGAPEDLLSNYIDVLQDGSIELCKGKPLQDVYLQKLVLSMEKLFYSQYGVLPALVADVNQHVYKSMGCVGVNLEMVTMATKNAIDEERLFRCLLCSALSIIPEDWLSKGGILYNIAVNEVGLQSGEKYTFPRYGITGRYDNNKDSLIPIDVNCFHCSQPARQVSGDGSIQYQNGDRTLNRANPKFSKCCGYKHYWDGKEYDNLPEVYPLQLTWKGRQKTVKVYWFQNEADDSLNSNVYEVASQLVSEHYPGEFGSENIIQQVVDMLINATSKQQVKQMTHDDSMNIEDVPSLTKAISTGMGSSGKVLHKEELGVSEVERKMKRRVNEKLQQRQERPTRKTSPSPRDKPTSSPPSKISASDRSPSPSPKPSPPSPSTTKKIRVTLSDGKAVNLTLSHEATYNDLHMLIQEQLDIPIPQQRLRWGFPPKELRPPNDDPNQPLPLSNGERVSVEYAGGGPNASTEPFTAKPSSPLNSSPDRSPRSHDRLLAGNAAKSLFKEVDGFEEFRKLPHMFRKGGHCYEELMRAHGGNLKDHTHVQFAEMSDIVFRYNATQQRLEVCLGLTHVPVEQLTDQQRELARQTAIAQRQGEELAQEGSSADSIKYLVNRHGNNIKAFSGAGHTLGGTSSSASGGGDNSITDRGGIDESISSILDAARMIMSTRLKSLQEKEQFLLHKIRNLNQQILENTEAATASNMPISSMETELLEASSELKQIRDEIREISML